MHGFEFLEKLVLLSFIAVLVILAFRRLNIPPIIGLIVTGILAGSSGFQFIAQTEVITVLAELGVTMLLFSIGLEFSLDDLVSLRKIVLLGGPLQIIISTLVLGAGTYLITTVTNSPLSWGSSIAIGMITALSSTAICIKLLKDRDELLTPHGRAVLGILIFQDIAVVPMLIVISLLSPGSDFSLGSVALRLIVVAVSIVVLTWLLRLVFPRIVKYVTRTDTPEVLVLGALTLCFGAAAVTNSMGMSLALGAFIAGVAISESEDSRYIDRVMAPFKDAFTSIFFISVGLLLNVRLVDLPLNIVAAILVVIANAVVVTVLLRLLGMQGKDAITAGIVLAEVGEFSFVLASTALQGSVIHASTYQNILVIIIITMVVTPALVSMAPRLSTMLPGYVKR